MDEEGAVLLEEGAAVRVRNLRSCASNPEELSVETLSGNRTVQKVPSRALCVFRRKDVEEENGVLSFSAMQFFPLL